MKILIVIPRIPAPPNDGGAIYVYHIIKHMVLLGHELVMASFESNRHKQNPEMMSKYCRLYSLSAHFKPYNIPSVIKSTFTRQPISIQHRMDVNLMNKILSMIPDESFDLISIEGIHSARFIGIAKSRYPNTPVIIRQANVEHSLLKRNANTARNLPVRWFLHDQSRLMKKFETHALLSADGITAISPVDRQEFLKLIPDLFCEVVEVGADLPEKRDIIRHNHTMLAISNWEWRPNIDGLVWFLENIWPKLNKIYPELKFLIAGYGIPNRLQKKLKKLRITYLGFVDDIEELRQKATMMVVPLLSGSGLKLKILEGLASGIPIITTSIGSEGIAMKDGIHYLLAETPEEFIEQIGRLLNDQGLREKLSGNGRSLIEKEYQWEQKAERLEQFVQQIIDKYHMK